jgi:hypothetical protein
VEGMESRHFSEIKKKVKRNHKKFVIFHWTA